jgi:hypothetical protein
MERLLIMTDRDTIEKKDLPEQKGIKITAGVGETVALRS